MFDLFREVHELNFALPGGMEEEDDEKEEDVSPKPVPPKGH